MNISINQRFLIANKTTKLIKTLSDLLELVPKKYYFQKNKTLNYAYDLLEIIYTTNYTLDNKEKNLEFIQKTLVMLDFSISFFIDKKIISIK